MNTIVLVIVIALVLALLDQFFVPQEKKDYKKYRKSFPNPKDDPRD